MAWIWSGGVKALQKQYLVEWKQPTCPSSLEVDGETETVRRINPIVRFSKIFRKIAPLYHTIPSEERQAIEDVLLHILAELDRKSGICRMDFAIDARERALQEGRYGIRVQHLFAMLPPEDRYTIARLLVRQEEDTSGRLFYDDALAALFPDVRSFYETDDDVIVLHFPRPKRKEDRARLDLIAALFLDRTAVVREYWERPFGILGEPRTTRLDHFQMY